MPSDHLNAIDRILFEHFKPEGIAYCKDHFNKFVGPTPWHWSPSRNWSDLEPLIVAACKKYDANFKMQWYHNQEPSCWCAGFANDVSGLDVFGTACDFAPKAAAIALTALIERKRDE